MNQSFLGSGWSFPLQFDEQGRLVMARHEESVRQSIWLILSTAPGERVMQPDFGCGIHDLVFAPNTPGTAGQVVGEVRNALIRWEPRIDLESVSAVQDPGYPNRLLILIAYQTRATNSRFNLVYPFYLE